MIIDNRIVCVLCFVRTTIVIIVKINVLRSKYDRTFGQHLSQPPGKKVHGRGVSADRDRVRGVGLAVDFARRRPSLAVQAVVQQLVHRDVVVVARLATLQENDEFASTAAGAG